MKTFKTIWLGLLLFSVASCTVVKKSVSEKKTIQQKIESKDFTFFVDRCLPTGLEISTFNSDVNIKIKNETAYGNLPFHGLLNVNPQERTEGPISFNGPKKGYTMTHDSKGWRILFKIVSDPYIYQVDMTISTDAKAIVKVTSTKS